MCIQMNSSLSFYNYENILHTYIGTHYTTSLSNCVEFHNVTFIMMHWQLHLMCAQTYFKRWAGAWHLPTCSMLAELSSECLVYDVQLRRCKLAPWLIRRLAWWRLTGWLVAGVMPD